MKQDSFLPDKNVGDQISSQGGPFACSLLGTPKVESITLTVVNDVYDEFCYHLNNLARPGSIRFL